MATIRVFASTTATQGKRTNDFCFVPEGEVVSFPFLVCSGERADGFCGCARAMDGIHSHRGTTTARVIEISWEHFMKIYHELANPSEYLQAAALFPLGSIVEFRDGEFYTR